MTPSTAHDRQADQSRYLISPASKIHTDLLDRLANTLAHLSRAQNLLRSAIENGDAAQYKPAYFEVERLRTDFSNIRIELERRPGLGSAGQFD